ncbi:winged helix-turn-helix domain-containing protein [Vibrio casei]
MIPTYQEFMRPLLEIASNGNEIKIRDAINSLADQFHLTQDERLEKLPSGRVTVLD